MRLLRFRSILKSRIDSWGRLLVSPAYRLLPVLLGISRFRRPPRWLVRPLRLPLRRHFGRRRPRPPSAYGKAMRSLRQLHSFYLGLSRRWLVFNARDRSAVSMLSLLESLPIPLLVRARLVKSPFQARQLLAHGLVLLENRVVASLKPVRVGQLLRISNLHANPPRRYSVLGVTMRLPSPPGPPVHLEISQKVCALVLLRNPAVGRPLSAQLFSLLKR